MHKMSLLLVVLSVCALHAADEKEKAEALPMKRIERIGQLTWYKNVVIAYTALSYRLCNDAFTLEQDGLTLCFGVVKYEYDCCNRIFSMAMRRFVKMDGGNGDYGLATVNGNNPEECPLWEEEDEEYIKQTNMKIRRATQDEKIQLKQAILNGKAKLDYDLPPNRAAALSYLAED